MVLKWLRNIRHAAVVQAFWLDCVVVVVFVGTMILFDISVI